MSGKTIFVKLLDEAVDVWRPVVAEQLVGGIYRISDQTYDMNTETWEFEPGAFVVADEIETADGRIVAAIGRAEFGAPN